MRFNLLFLTLLASIFLLLACDKNNETLFTKLSPESTGIKFANRIIETNARNVFNFEYIYNGGGVALGDFNNDNLVDIYFTGNQVENKLYINKSATEKESLQFEDITQESKATGEGRWCSGVTLVDINNDNRLDIYISATVSKVSDRLANILYVNQGVDKSGIPTFKDMAKEYGLADTSHTNNAAFFDYDNDGDLDVFLLVNEMEKVRYPNKYVEKINDGSSKRTDRLYENDGTNEHPHFTNISKKAGILLEGYGLGVNITDINRDGWKDIYITNDFLTDDILYINNGKGASPQFTDQSARYFKHTSYSAMGNDIADLNNDGLMDIVALDMLPEENSRKKMMLPANNYSTYQNNEKFRYNHQYARNTLQLNQGTNPQTGQPIFSEVGLMAGIAETDWSWCPMVIDFDNDGFRDIIVSNGFPKDVTDHDFLSYRYQSSVFQKASLEELLSQMPSIKVSNYAFRNKKSTDIPAFEEVTAAWGMDIPSFSNGSAYADLDNDGDLDFVVNNINDSAFVFRNNAMQLKPTESNYLRIKCKGSERNIGGIGAFIEISYNNGEKQIYENTPYRGYLSTIENVAHFGLGKITMIDEIKVTWQSGKVSIVKNQKANQTLIIDEKSAIEIKNLPLTAESSIFQDFNTQLGTEFLHVETDFIDFNIQKLLPHKFSQFGPAIAVGDVNNDGLEDVFIGGATNHKGTFLIQNQTGKFAKKDLIQNETDATKFSEDAGVLLFDADRDNDLDLYIVSGSNEAAIGSQSYQDRLYVNDGKGNFTQNPKALPLFLKSGSCVKATDFDHDGDLDLFVGGRVEVNAYPKPVSSYVLRNDGGIFTDVSDQFAPQLQNIGLVSDALWSDYDDDGWQDLIIVGELMPITVFKNKKGKSLEKINNSALDSQIGFWNSLVSGDFDDDGDTDYIAGNQGINTLYKVSDEFPLTFYGKDFNYDGFYDAIPTVFFSTKEKKRKEVTYNVKDDLVKQISAFREKFTNYASFASTDIYGIFSKTDIKDALILRANNMQSSYIENLGKSEFKITALPMPAQIAPIFGMLVEDFDNDGNLDVLMVGNDFGNELSVGRLDAFNGLFFSGNGKGGFIQKNLAKTAFAVTGDAKGLVRIKNAAGNNLIMASQNQGKVQTFSMSNLSESKPLQANDATGMISLKKGKKRKVEFYYGSSFLSQSSRSLLISNHFKAIELIDFQGKRRKI